MKFKSALILIMFFTFVSVSFSQSYDKETGRFTDPRDNNVYKWVKIGKQIWMAENLRYKTETGFSAVQTGIYTKGSFNHDSYTSWWTSSADETKAWIRHIGFFDNTIGRVMNRKVFAFSVRCIKNDGIPLNDHTAAVKRHDDIPNRFDWREKNIMTPVKHQMNLGSCGVFAAVAVFESLIKKETGKAVDLSEQQVINGSRDFVASGISSVDAMKYMKQVGLVLEARLPYQDKKTDQMPDGPPDYRLTDYHYVQTDKLALSEKIETFKAAIWKHGPVATNMIFYQDLDRYRQGVYMVDGKSQEQGGHWVVVVGWQDDPEVKNGGYWICRNSWGDRWGEKGYFNIAYGECGIDDFWFVYGIFEP